MLFSPGSNGMPSRTKNRMPNWLYFGTYRNAPLKTLFSLVKPDCLWFTGLLPTPPTERTQPPVVPDMPAHPLLRRPSDPYDGTP